MCNTGAVVVRQPVATVGWFWDEPWGLGRRLGNVGGRRSWPQGR